MELKNSPVKNNFLKSRVDFQNAVNQVCTPLTDFYSDGGTMLEIGDTGSLCSERVACMEAFSRPLWGLVPMTAGGGDSELWEIYLKGFRNGTNPGHQEYWGDVEDTDQRMVEMAVLGLALAMAPEKVWNPLNDKEKQNFSKWMYQINNHIVVDTNWLFFRVLVNVGLKKVGAEYSDTMLQKDLNRLDEFYLGEGWYQDGFTNQQDYYIPFAFHYYSLIYSELMKEEDPERSGIYKDRAKIFAKDFIYWFSTEGSSIPFGRSLTYRFAQSAFWSALAFAGVEVFPWGVVKGLVCRNLRWWFSQPIFNASGILTIGYAYPNMNMAEGYNAPGSPYWALKTFLLLVLDENHPFWLAEEEDIPELDSMSVQCHPRMLLSRQEQGKHVIAYTAGQHAGFEPVHCAEKYEKFAYSNLFGFSVPRGNFGLQQLAGDSMLALSEGDNIYRVRRKSAEYIIDSKYVYSKWFPWEDVEVNTWVIPVNSWHVRIHYIKSKRNLDLAEGGFAIAREKALVVPPADSIKLCKSSLVVRFPWGSSGIIDMVGERTAELIRSEPNTNLLVPRAYIPTLTGSMSAGEKLLICAVLGETAGIDSWDAPPKVTSQQGRVFINDVAINVF